MKCPHRLLRETPRMCARRKPRFAVTVGCCGWLMRCGLVCFGGHCIQCVTQGRSKSSLGASIDWLTLLHSVILTSSLLQRRFRTGSSASSLRSPSMRCEPPRLNNPPIRSVRLNQASYEAGIETHQLDGVPVKVYSREKALVDCFKHRSDVGLDTVLEAVRMYKAQGRVDVDTILRFAAICRVARVARPYLESLL